jgi:predicted esterase
MGTLSQLAGYDYRFEAGAHPGGPGRKVLLLLHGTGGNEHSLIPFARIVAPEADVIAPRGNVSENGALRYFRRIAEGVFDAEDLKRRTEQLGQFTLEAGKKHGFDASQVIAVGYSNGANIAASVMLSAPDTLRHAVLLRAMLGADMPATPDVSRSSALIVAGTTDQLIPQANTEKLASILRQGGCKVELKWLETGHGLVQEDATLARDYLRAWPLVSV